MPYLLPCPQCDRKLPVTTGQAGDQVRCQCGTAIDVPTVRGLRELVEVQEATAPRKAWTTRNSIVFLGAVITLAGLALAAFLHVRADHVRPHENFADDIRTMAPRDTWELWSSFLQQGIRWNRNKGPEQLKAIKDYEELKRWEWIAFGLAGAGVVLVLIGLTLVGQRGRGTPKRPPRRPIVSAERK
jgi:hypothetical protein